MAHRHGNILLVNEQVIMGQARFMCFHDSEISEACRTLLADTLEELCQFFTYGRMELDEEQRFAEIHATIGEALFFIEFTPVYASA